jgi:16S rRNA (guanine527-N7)-methyltransferase
VKHAERDALDAIADGLRQKLTLYVDLLTRWNRTIQLVSSSDMPLLWQRHIADALQLLPFFPPGLQRAIDLGSGGGLPGLVLALASGVHFDLVESDGRKASFLREAASITGAPVTVHAARIEAVALQPARLITARALAPLSRLLTLAYPLLTPDGICLFPKGSRFQAELDDAEKDWTMTTQSSPSATAPDARLLSIRAIQPKGQRS